MKKSTKVIILIIKILICAAVLVGDYFLLEKYEYISNFGQVDNIVGMLPVTFTICFTGCFFILLFLNYKKPHKIVASVLVVFTAIFGALFPASLTGSWFKPHYTKGLGPDVDVTLYEPFKEGTKAYQLSEPSLLTIDSDFPVLDGAIALYPVYASFGQNIYNPTTYKDEVRFTNTIKAFTSLVDGDVDIFFSATPGKTQMDYAKSKNKEIVMTPIGKEAFVFVVPKSNPIDNLTYQQIKNIYSGKTSMWSTLGWKEGGKMIKFQRPEGSGSQSMLEAIMKNIPIHTPDPLPSKDMVGNNRLMTQITLKYKGVQPAIGYSFKFYATQMNPNPDAKFLKINGVEPSPENIKNGTYIFTTQFYAMTVGEPTGNVKKVIDFILSDQGQEIIEQNGYTRLN